ncbi:unnamed protein product [Rhizopus stolonifer]
MNIKQNFDHKYCILWARRLKKNVDKVLNITLEKLKNRRVEEQIKIVEGNAELTTTSVEPATTISVESPTITGVEECTEEYEEDFKMLDPSKKWYLPTGKCVDNELFLFGQQCNYDHPSRSYIMDPNDKNYIIYNVFAAAELEEITNHTPRTSCSLRKI